LRHRLGVGGALHDGFSLSQGEGLIAADSPWADIDRLLEFSLSQGEGLIAAFWYMYPFIEAGRVFPLPRRGPHCGEPLRAVGGNPVAMFSLSQGEGLIAAGIMSARWIWSLGFPSPKERASLRHGIGTPSESVHGGFPSPKERASLRQQLACDVLVAVLVVFPLPRRGPHCGAGTRTVNVPVR